MSDVEVIGFRTRMSAAEQSFVAAMRRLYEEGRGTDVTLVCGNVRLQVHSAVLIARFMKHDTLLLINFFRSEFFEAKIARWADEKGEIVLEDCDPGALGVVVAFMYGIDFTDMVIMQTLKPLIHNLFLSIV